MDIRTLATLIALATTSVTLPSATLGQAVPPPLTEIKFPALPDNGRSYLAWTCIPSTTPTSALARPATTPACTGRRKEPPSVLPPGKGTWKPPAIVAAK